MSLIQRQIYISQSGLCVCVGDGQKTFSKGKANSLCICLWVNLPCGQIWLSAAETWYSSTLQAVPNSHFSIKLCVNTCLAFRLFFTAWFPGAVVPAALSPAECVPRVPCSSVSILTVCCGMLWSCCSPAVRLSVPHSSVFWCIAQKPCTLLQLNWITLVSPRPCNAIKAG